MQKFFMWCFSVAVLVFAIPYLAVEIKKPSDINRGKSGGENQITVLINGENVKMPFEEYIIGVVCAEMPALFEEEAIKAQAVAARTYTVSKTAGGAAGHNGADICALPSHCQAYAAKDEVYAEWGAQADKYYEKIKNAVLATKGEILIYQNEPIRAVFHSSNNGRTENAADVWGGDFPYLKSVESYGEDLSPKYLTEYTVDYNVFCERIKEAHPEADFSLPLEKITRTEGGAAKDVYIFGTLIKGVEMRSLFMLKSADFDIKITGGDVVFTVHGYGHGVGMSQYGANYMAASGKNYIEILQTYYVGAQISMYNP